MRYSRDQTARRPVRSVAQTDLAPLPEPHDLKRCNSKSAENNQPTKPLNTLPTTRFVPLGRSLGRSRSRRLGLCLVLTLLEHRLLTVGLVDAVALAVRLQHVGGVDVLRRLGAVVAGREREARKGARDVRVLAHRRYQVDEIHAVGQRLRVHLLHVLTVRSLHGVLGRVAQHARHQRLRDTSGVNGAHGRELLRHLRVPHPLLDPRDREGQPSALVLRDRRLLRHFFRGPKIWPYFAFGLLRAQVQSF